MLYRFMFLLFLYLYNIKNQISYSQCIFGLIYDKILICVVKINL